MPGITTAALPRVDSAETLTTQAVLQGLSISPSLVSSMQMEASAWSAAEDGDADAQAESLRQQRRKRNKSDVVNPTSPKRRWGDANGNENGNEIVLESLLTVVERIDHAPAPSIARTMGDIRCRILKKNGGCWLMTVSDDEDMTLHLSLAEMNLLFERCPEQRDFSLRRQVATPSQPSCFVFTAVSGEECSEWVRALEAVTAPCAEASVKNDGEQSETTSHPNHRQNPAPAASNESASAETTARRGTKHSGLVYSIPPKITHVILVRHGHYVNAHVKDISDSHQVLSQMGHRQAKLTGEYLQQLYHRLPRHNHISIYHSDLTRAVETAQGICESFCNATPISSPSLREGWPGAPFFANQTPTSFLQTKDAQQEDLDRQDQARMEEVFKKLFMENPEEDQGTFRIVVCHANLIRYCLCRALRLDPRHLWGHFEINHCGITRIDLARSRPLKVINVNETGHLPHSLITSSEDHL